MGVPEGSFAVASFIVFALPGLIYAAVGRWARGESSVDRDLGLLVTRGAIFAIALTAGYLGLFGGWVFGGLGFGGGPDALVIVNAQLVGITVLVLYLAVPASISFLVQRKHIEWVHPRWAMDADGGPRRGCRWVRIPRSRHGYSSAASAWDHAVTENHNAWVKVKRANGDWVGGWYSKGSFVTTYPEPRSIYIAEQSAMNDDGTFAHDEPLEPKIGVFLMINEGDMVFWEKPTPEAEEEANDE